MSRGVFDRIQSRHIQRQLWAERQACPHTDGDLLALKVPGQRHTALMHLTCRCGLLLAVYRYRDHARGWEEDYYYLDPKEDDHAR